MRRVQRILEQHSTAESLANARSARRTHSREEGGRRWQGQGAGVARGSTMSVYDVAATGKGDGLRSSMRKATRAVEKAVGAVGASDLLSEGEAAGESEGPHTWPKVKGAAIEEDEEEESAAYVTAAVFEDVTLQSGGMDGLVAKEADRKGYMFKKGKNKRDEFKKRWFELRGGKLSYFAENGGQFKGVIDVASDDCKQVRVSEADGASQFEIEIVCAERTYRLETRDTDERRAWISALQDARHGEAAAKLRRSMAGEDPPESAMEEGSLSETSYFGDGSGAAAKLKAKREVEAKRKEKTQADKWTRPDHDGWLVKLGEKRKSWKKRWFELRGPMLSYYVEPAGEEKGHLDLRHAAVQQIRISESVESEKFELEIVCVDRTYRLACAVAEDRKEWIEELHRARAGEEKVRNAGRAGLSDGEEFLDGGSGVLDEAYTTQPEEEPVYSEDPDHCSWMAKKGARRGFSGSAWKKRWFELRGAKLEYFVDEGDDKKGEILLNSSECEAIRVSQAKDAMANELEIVTEDRVFRLVCDSRESRKEWIEELQRARMGVRKHRPEEEQEREPEGEPGTYAPAFAERHQFSMDGDADEETTTSHARTSGANDAGIGGTNWAAAFDDSDSDEEGVPEGVPTSTGGSGSIYGPAPAPGPAPSLYGELFGDAGAAPVPAPAPSGGAGASLYSELFGSAAPAPAPAPVAAAPVAVVEVEVELREDPEDGELYTREEFVEQYGGTAEWDRAKVHRFKAPTAAPASIYETAAPAPAPVPAAVAEVELREDPDDGELYTKEEFVEQYGGTVEWEQAAVHRFKAPTAAPAAAPAAPATTSIYDTAPTSEATTTAAASSGGSASLYGSLFDDAAAPAPGPVGVAAVAPASGSSASSSSLYGDLFGADAPTSAPAPIPAAASTGGGSLYSDMFGAAPTPAPAPAPVTGGYGQLSSAAEAAKAGAAADAARIAALGDGSSSSEEEEEEDEDEEAAPLDLIPVASRGRSSTVPSREGGGSGGGGGGGGSGLGALGLPPVETRGRSSSSPGSSGSASPSTPMRKAGSSPSPRGSGKARRMSLAPTPLLDTLVQLANNDINPNQYDLNDPNALAMAAVAAMDAEGEEEEENSDTASMSSVGTDGGGFGALSSFSEQVR